MINKCRLVIIALSDFEAKKSLQQSLKNKFHKGCIQF